MEQQNLQQFIQSSSSYITQDDYVNGSFTGQYQGYSVYAKAFKGQTKQCVGYKFFMPNLGVEKVLESTSVKLARLMSDIKQGTNVTIHKEGEAFETTWSVTPVTTGAETTTNISEFEQSLKEQGMLQEQQQQEEQENIAPIENIPF